MPPKASYELLSAQDQEAARNVAATSVQAATDFASGKRDAKQEILASKARCNEFFDQFKKEEPQGQFKMGMAVCLRYFAKPLIFLGILYFKLLKLCYAVYLLIPMNFVSLIFGGALCFFGGTYYATIAAIEGFRQFGGTALWDELAICWEEGSRAGAALDEDAKVDADKDGIADVNQMDMNTWSTHVTVVSMVAVKDPSRLQTAVQFLMTTWLAVLAVLKFQFAKTISLCLAIAEMLEMPACRILGPLLAVALGPELNHWCFAIISTTIKIIAVCVASYVQSIVSAFYSGLRGGNMFAQGLINIVAQRGWLDNAPFAKDKDGKFDPNLSILDECIAYPLAAAGFYWQFTNAFALPFPYSLIMFPFTVVDWILKWQIFMT